MSSGCSDKAHADTMKDEKPVMEDSVGGGVQGSAAQNGGGLPQAEEAPGTERSDFPRMGSESNAGTRPQEEAPRKRFQIPRKSRDKRAQLISSDSREFEEILKILHSAYLDANSKANFTYKCARLVHNEFLEKEFTEKRRELKIEGRLDKELAESYAFLLVNQEQVHSMSERGLHVGHSRLTTLGKPSMGVYLSKFADLLQPNPLEAGLAGNIFIFKVIKGKIKYIYDNMRNNQMDSHGGSWASDPAPKHECHVLKNTNTVNSLLSYRAFERTQYYFYEYAVDEIRNRPRHVCPYAVVSFGYQEDMMHRQPSVSGTVNFNADRSNDRSIFTLWRGQLLSKGKLLCYASFKSTNGPFFPYRLPEKLDLEILVRLDQIKKKIPSILFCKETHNKPKEVMVGGIFSRLYEVCDKTRTGNHLQSLLQKLDREKLALVKPLADKGFLFLYFPSQMTSSYSSQSGKSRVLHALFIYPESRETLTPASHFSKSSTVTADNNIIMPDLTSFVSALRMALHKSQGDASAELNMVVEKHIRIYLKRKAEGSYKYKEYVPKPYDSRLDYKKSLYLAPRDKSRIEEDLRKYMLGPEAYVLTVDKAQELSREHQRFQQFSPVSDYEPIEEDHEGPKPLSRKGSALVSPAESGPQRVGDHSDQYDLDKITGLINLIQSRKQNAYSNPEAAEVSVSGLKRKLESGEENEWKHQKTEDVHQNCETSENTHSMSSFISALGGQDTDLRQENPESPIDDSTDCVKALLSCLADTYFNSSLTDSLNKVFDGESENKNHENFQNSEYVPSTHDTDRDISRHHENKFYGECGPQSLEPRESSPAVLTSPTNDTFQPGEEMIIEESAEPPSESISSCPSTPTECLYRQSSAASNTESGMHWKLIPITGLAISEEQIVSPGGAPPGDPRALHRRRQRSASSSSLQDNRKERSKTLRLKGNYREHSATPPKREQHFKAKHKDNGLIENAVMDAYRTFSESLHKVLKQKDVEYTGQAPAPLLSSDERVARLSDWLNEQASNISVDAYVEDLREKLDSVVASCSNPRERMHCNVDTEIKTEPEVSEHVRENAECGQPQPVQPGTDASQNAHRFYRAEKEDIKPFSKDTEHDLAVGHALDKDSAPVHDFPADAREKPVSSVPEQLSASQTALVDVISQMHPEVFNNLVKIFTHVNKNVIKFYIHAEEENAICEEIRDYLLKLGNAQCHPDTFLSCSVSSDKLLIIIQNEDIAHFIHKIPSLITLKKLPCVSFAGIDSLDDLKNYTYNELFVSGGFVVSDETVLNPETMTVDALKKFLAFLEEIAISAKWQWKIHCKFQKKLKELGRLNANALNILTLLNTYQKKHLVEILSYHNCDSKTRQAPELDCLIRLQVQNIQQRHVLFLTEKDPSLFPNYSDNGILVTRMEDFMRNFTSQVGFCSSNPEENCLSQLARGETQTAPGETDVKEEEDMSLDSEDETPQIEVCTDSLKLEPHALEGTKQPDFIATSQPEATGSIAQNPTPNPDPTELHPVTPVSTTGSAAAENSTPAADEVLSGFQEYPNTQLGISQQLNHFNVLTHQTFLPAMYPILASQTQPGNYFLNSYSQVPESDPSQNSEWEKPWHLK
ncbi:protein TASOR [Spea bombifrons]|uniref:protein TASOR n=1 Tax=Spea bombifrons TaxID=233779 RepID=UPI00234936E3|nr:protein TASOR [Spea bombifrons]